MVEHAEQQLLFATSSVKSASRKAAWRIKVSGLGSGRGIRCVERLSGLITLKFIVQNLFVTNALFIESTANDTLDFSDLPSVS